MLSISKIGAGAGAQGYSDYQFLEALKNREDYYASEQDKGRWAGTLAATLGLASDIEKGQLLAMLQGYHPVTGEALASNAGLKHKAGWDLTFSSPKTVSAVWAVAQPPTREAIEKAQQAAVKAALKFLEERAFVSRDRDGKTVDKILAALFQHGTSREKDPQLHTHAAMANMGLRPDGTACAIEFDLRWKMAAGALYRAELAAELQKLGFPIERDGDSFKIAGISDPLARDWSKRSGQIREQLESKGFTSAKAAEVAALATRKGKETSPRSELFARWELEAAAYGVTPDMIEALRFQPASEAAGALDPFDPDVLLKALVAHESVFTEHQVWQVVATAAQGTLDTDGIRAKVKEFLQHKDILELRKLPAAETKANADKRDVRRSEAHYTTRAMWELERNLATNARSLAADRQMAVPEDQVAAAITAFEAAKGFELSPEQRKAVLHVTSETGQLAVVRGAAGAGKTTMLEAAATAWGLQGHRVRGGAIAGKAAAGLAKVGIESQTIASIFNDPGAFLQRGDVLIIDEAGMVGSADMSQLVNLCATTGAKLVLVGDEKQLQAISAGGAFKLLQRLVGRFAELLTNWRQADAADRKAAEQMAEGNAADALKSYAERGRICVGDTPEKTAAALVSDWGAAAHAVENRLVLTQRRADARMLNDLIRQQRHERGELVNECKLQAASGSLQVAEGDRLMLLKNDRRLGINNGHLATVERIEIHALGRKLTVAVDDLGKSVSFLVGDLADKALAKVARKEGLAIYDQFSHGYAITTHKAQGATVQAAYVYGLGDREMSYVQLTRHVLEGRLYLTAKQLESVVDAAESEAAIQPATPGMVATMLGIAKADGLTALPEEGRDFRSVREWLDEHSGQALGYQEQVSSNVDPELRELLQRLQEACRAMSVSHQKETTQDYQVVDTTTKQQPDLAPLAPAPAMELALTYD